MGLVHAYKKGEVPASKVSQAVKDAAKSMKKKSTKDFASTKHDDLPDKVREYLMSENPAASAAAAMAMMQLQNPDTGKKVSAITPLRDKDHKLHKKSKGIFQRLKDKFMKKNESINEDVFAIVDKYNDRKQDYDQVYFKDNNLNKVKKHMKKMGKKYGKMNLIRVKSNGKMSVVENLKEDGHTDVASAERKLKLIMKDAMDTLNALRSLSNEDSLPSWWTDKITLAKDYVGKSRDYIMNPAESVNEESKTIKSIQNLADKNKYGTVSGTRMNGKTAKEIIAIYNHPKMKSFKGKMDKLKSHELMDLTIRLPKILGIKVESANENIKDVMKNAIHQVKTFDKPSNAKLMTIKVINKLKEKRNSSKSTSNKKQLQKMINKVESDYKKGKYLKESVNEVSGVDVAKRVLKNKQYEKGIDLQTANLIVTIDKAYDKNPKLQKKFRALQLPKMKQLILKYYG